jgi:hypothetical protein
MIFLGENLGSVFPNPSMRTVRADYAHSCCGLCALTIRTVRTELPDDRYILMEDAAASLPGRCWRDIAPSGR